MLLVFAIISFISMCAAIRFAQLLTKENKEKLTIFRENIIYAARLESLKMYFDQFNEDCHFSLGEIKDAIEQASSVDEDDLDAYLAKRVKK